METGNALFGDMQRYYIVHYDNVIDPMKHPSGMQVLE